MYGEIGGEVAILYRQTTGDKETETYEETVRKIPCWVFTSSEVFWYGVHLIS